jgi:hypothetical protein
MKNNLNKEKMTTLFPEETQYRVLTLWQPWASLLVHGIKRIETRPSATSWTSEKGVYLIHAASKWTKEQRDICMTEPFASALKGIGYKPEEFDSVFKLPTGQIIGAIEIIGCRKIRNENGIITCIGKQSFFNIKEPELSFGDYSTGRFAWLTHNPRILKTPIPYKGGQGYYQKFKGDINKLEFI